MFQAGDSLYARYATDLYFTVQPLNSTGLSRRKAEYVGAFTGEMQYSASRTEWFCRLQVPVLDDDLVSWTTALFWVAEVTLIVGTYQDYVNSIGGGATVIIDGSGNPVVSPPGPGEITQNTPPPTVDPKVPDAAKTIGKTVKSPAITTTAFRQAGTESESAGKKWYESIPLWAWIAGGVVLLGGATWLIFRKK